MPLLRIVLQLALVVFGGAGMLLGAVVTMSALSNGSLMLSHGEGAGEVITTISRANDPERFWRTLTFVGMGPLLLGFCAVVAGWRWLRRAH